MSRQLVYTSASRGLKPGSSGFCAVAADGGMSQALMTKLELLSGYEFRYNLSDPNAERNPINFSHTRITLGGQTSSVLSRVAFSGADYSGRTNKIAHHFLLEQEERLPGGPAWMMHEMARGGQFRTVWNDSPRALASSSLRELLPAPPPDRQPLKEWSRLGDPGWAGALARGFCRNKKVPSYVIFQPGTHLLPLFEEGLRLLPPNMRWDVCFTTYYTSAPPDCHYHWRGVLAGSSAMREIARFPGAVVINLTKPLPPVAAGNEDEFVAAARQGCVIPSLLPPTRSGPPDRAAQVAGVPIPLGPDDDEEGPGRRARDSKMADLASAARTAPMAAAPPPHFVTVEKAPRWMKWAVSVLAVLVCALLLLNATTLRLLYRSGKDGDTPSAVPASRSPAEGQTASTTPATRADGAEPPAESGPKTQQTTPQPSATQNSELLDSQPATATPRTSSGPTQDTSAKREMPKAYARVPVKRLVSREGVRPGEEPVEWLVQAWTNVELISSFKTDTTEDWQLLDLPDGVKKAGLRSEVVVDDRFSVCIGESTSSGSLIAAWLGRSSDGEKIILSCRMDEGASADGRLRLEAQCLVFELRARKAEKTVRFALRPKEPQRCTARCGWIDEKAVTPLKSLEPRPSYPWPDLLQIGLRGGGSPSDSVALDVDNPKANLRIEPLREDDKSSITLSAPEFDKQLSEWHKQLEDKNQELQRSGETEAELKNQLAKAEEKDKKNKQDEIGKKQNEQQQLIDQIEGIRKRVKDASAKLKKLGPIVVYDPWDLPVAEVTIELVPPADGGTPGGRK